MPNSGLPDAPFFSIVIPTYNSVQKLAKSLDSVLGQEGASYEILVIDGASADGTLGIIKSYAERHPDIIRWVSEKDKGVYDAMNKGIDMARGTYLYFLGAGDTMRLGVLAKVQQAVPEADMAFVYGDVRYVRLDKVGDGECDRLKFVRENICHQGIFYERGIFATLGKYDLRYPILADKVINIQCFGAKSIRKIYLDTVIADYEGGGMSDTTTDQVFAGDASLLLEKHLGLRVRERYFFVVERGLANRIRRARNVLKRKFWHAQLWLLHKLVRPLLEMRIGSIRPRPSLDQQYIIVKLHDA